MRVLILGGTGMLGHQLWQILRPQFDTWATLRTDFQAVAKYDLFDPQYIINHVDAFDLDSVARAISTVQPSIVINCVGIIKQLPTAKDPITSLVINALFPHKLARLCQVAQARLIHISTDCVFSGRKGMYTEDDVSDAEDLYGRTKFLGEISGPGCLTLRTSIIGRELQTTSGLVEWFLSNRNGAVRGYTQAIYSGFPTIVLARLIVNIIEHNQDLEGIYQVSSEPITKYDLLQLMREAYDIPIQIEPSSDVQIDRSLDSSRFRALTGFVPLPWSAMIQEMAQDPSPYEDWRAVHVS